MARNSMYKRCRICRREGLTGYAPCKHKKVDYVIVYREGNKQRTENAGPNKKEAERRLNEINTRLANNTFVNPKKAYFKDFVAKWLEIYAKENIKISTYHTYLITIDRHILPDLGHYEVSQISSEVIQGLITKIKGVRSAKTANNVLVLLKTIMKYAHRWEYVVHNPTDRVDRVKSEQKEMGHLQAKDVRILLEHAPEGLYKTLFMMAIFTGMRMGELLALQWADIDWSRNFIHVKRSIYWATKHRDEHGRLWRFITPKTKNSYRSIFLTPKLREALETYKEQANKSTHDLVFCGDEGQPLNPANVRNKHFFPTLKRAGLNKIRFHDLRHTYVSLLIDQGQNIKFIQSQVGHASVQTTLDRYAHLMPLETYIDVATKLDSILTTEQNPKSL